MSKFDKKKYDAIALLVDDKRCVVVVADETCGLKVYDKFWDWDIGDGVQSGEVGKLYYVRWGKNRDWDRVIKLIKKIHFKAVKE